MSALSTLRRAPKAPAGSLGEAVAAALAAKQRCVGLAHWRAHRLSVPAWTSHALELGGPGFTEAAADELAAKLQSPIFTAAWSGVANLSASFNETMQPLGREAFALTFAPALASWPWTSDGGVGVAELAAAGVTIGQGCAIAGLVAIRARPDLAGTATSTTEPETRRLAAEADYRAALEAVGEALAIGDVEFGPLDREGRSVVVIRGTDIRLAEGWPQRLIEKLAAEGRSAL